jgi:hypothetical protein
VEEPTTGRDRLLAVDAVEEALAVIGTAVWDDGLEEEEVVEGLPRWIGMGVQNGALAMEGVDEIAVVTGTADWDSGLVVEAEILGAS